MFDLKTLFGYLLMHSNSVALFYATNDAMKFRIFEGSDVLPIFEAFQTFEHWA